MGKLRRLKHMILTKVMHAMYLMALAVMVVRSLVDSKYRFYWRPEPVIHPPQLHTIIYLVFIFTARTTHPCNHCLVLIGLYQCVVPHLTGL